MNTSNGTGPITTGELAEKIGSVEFFSDLDNEILREIAREIKTFELAADEILVRQGEDAESMFLLIDGRLSVILERAGDERKIIADLPSGSIVGEIALVAGGLRSATVAAAEASTMGVLTAETFNRLLELHPEVASRVVSTVSRRLREGQLALYLTRRFEDLDPAFIKELEASVEWLSLDAGQTLFERDDPADACYLLVSGRLRAMPDAETGETPLYGDVVPGDIAGELSMVLGEPHTETMVAVRDSELARIPRPVFEEWIERRPRAMLEMARTAFRRSRKPVLPSDSGQELNRSIALVSLDNDLDLAALVEPIAEKLARYGETMILSSERVDALLHKAGVSQSGPGSPANIRLLQWLSEMERAHRYMVYVADCSQCEWTDRVIRQADHVVFVAEASGDSHLQEIEERHSPLFEKDPLRASLVLLHAPDTHRPEGTSRWLEERSVDAVYHLRRGNDRDLGRLARVLAGRAVSLVLGGGGARGFAHLGVLRALEELGVPIDMVGGTSIGAPVALAPAQGMDAGESLAVVSGAFRSLLDYTLPVASMLSGRRITGNIDAHALSWNIEDMWLPYFCVSTSITEARSVVHRRGNLARAVRASVSIPGVLPPVPFEENLHVDGGTLNNLPIDVMRQLNPTGTVLAVDVLPPKGPRAKADYPLGLSGWRVLLGRTLPWLKPVRVPPIGSTLLASMTIGSAGSLKRMLDSGLADLYLSINVKGISMLQFEAVEQIAEIGYEQSIDTLRRWADAESSRLT